MPNTSKTWDYFSKITGQTAAKCLKCGSYIQTKGGNTKGMINHLRLHDIKIEKCTASEVSKRTKQNNENILKFMKRETINELLAKCAAKDGFSFRGIAHSEAIRGYILSKNLDMPKSEITVKQCIMKFCKEKQEELKQQLIAKKQIYEKFSITVDEWTNNNCTRFINVTLHSPKRQYNFGLTKIDGSCNAKETIRLVESTLNKYGLNLKSDIVASTHDGASVMVKYGNKIDPINQLCYSHAIHLTVLSVLYSKTSRTETNNEAEEFSENNNDEDNECFNYNIDEYFSNDANINFIENEDSEEELLELTVDINSVIKETRRICKFFRNSPVRNSILQTHVVKKQGKNLNLLLDCRTRWNSLIDMINRFILLCDPIYITLEQLGVMVPSADHISRLKELVAILERLAEAVIEISKKEANLIISEGTMLFVFNKLKNIGTPLALNICTELIKRINERRNTPIVSLLMFLHNGHYPQSNEFLTYSSKNNIKLIAKQIYKRLFCEPDSEMLVDVEARTQEEGAFFDEDSLRNSLLTFLAPPKQSHESLQVEKELKIIEGNGKRTANLEQLYNALLTIKPTSVDCERAFSIAGNFCTKIRSRLNAETLSCLVFLKYYFKELEHN